MIKISENLYRINFYNLLNFPYNCIENKFKNYDWWFKFESDRYAKWEKCTKFFESNKKAVYHGDFPYNPLKF